MIHHRYGRYGPDAWKRRRQRRFQQRLPAIVPTVAIVHIQAPVHVGRIIFIVLTQPNESEDFELNEPLPLQRDSRFAVQTLLQTAVDNNPLTNRARIQAVEDIDDIKTLSKRGGQVTIVDEGLLERAKTLARADHKSNYPSGSLSAYRQYTEDYQTAYLDQFEKERKLIAKDLRDFPDAKAVNLAQKARKDRKTSFFPSSGRGPFHQRDLAVVSALHELELCQNLEEHLEKIHVYVDIYEEAFRNPKEEVMWPNPASF